MEILGNYEHAVCNKVLQWKGKSFYSVKILWEIKKKKTLSDI